MSKLTAEIGQRLGYTIEFIPGPRPEVKGTSRYRLIDPSGKPVSKLMAYEPEFA